MGPAGQADCSCRSWKQPRKPCASGHLHMQQRSWPCPVGPPLLLVQMSGGMRARAHTHVGCTPCPRACAEACVYYASVHACTILGVCMHTCTLWCFGPDDIRDCCVVVGTYVFPGLMRGPYGDHEPVTRPSSHVIRSVPMQVAVWLPAESWVVNKCQSNKQCIRVQMRANHW